MQVEQTFDGDGDEPAATEDVPIWRRERAPGTRRRFGQVGRIAAWLWFCKEVGDTFTMKEVREALGTGDDAEQLNRRLRELRGADWLITSVKDDATLRPDEYRVQAKGGQLWLPEERRAYRRFAPSARVRRQVIERDGGRCVVCGVAAGETYPESPGTQARLTIGHRIPQERLRSRGDADNLDNWRTECARCNETVRDVIPDPMRYDEVLVQVRRLNRGDKGNLLAWLDRGERTRSELDRVYDQARTLSHTERDDLITFLRSGLGSPRPRGDLA
jgi:hypothetical protein